jgi:hypothetical protein
MRGSEAKKSENAPCLGRFQPCPRGPARQNPAELLTRLSLLCSHLCQAVQRLQYIAYLTYTVLPRATAQQPLYPHTDRRLALVERPSASARWARRRTLLPPNTPEEAVEVPSTCQTIRLTFDAELAPVAS